MNRRQKIIVSVTGIFLVLLILVGLTYAYFLTKIQGNSETKSISVTTANLILEYGNGESGNIEATNIIPNTIIDEKDFTVTNKGNATVENYKVYLENLTNSLERKDDLVYTLTCTSSDDENSPCTNQITDETTFPSNNGVLLTNTIAEGDIHTYKLVLKYKEMNTDQSIDMNKQIKAKVNIYDEKTVFLIDEFLSNGVTVDNITFSTTDYNTVSAGDNFKITEIKDEIDYSVATQFYETTLSENNVGLFEALDDYGTSIFLRGPVSDNYVSFANKLWRILRINGDSSIRLILDGEIASSSFNTNTSSNSYVGYMYGSTGASSYDLLHQNNNDSTVKGIIDAWYLANIENAGFSSYVADTLFCGDKTISIGTGLDDYTDTYYSAYTRLWNDNPTPTLECAKGATDTYSRYTANSTISSRGVAVNSDLTYPIGLITADELVMAGAKKDATTYTATPFSDYTTAINLFQTMTPASFVSDGQYATILNYNTSLSVNNVSSSNESNRPVLNLKSNILFNGGDGTKTNPYTVALPNFS